MAVMTSSIRMGVSSDATLSSVRVDMVMEWRY